MPQGHLEYYRPFAFLMHSSWLLIIFDRALIFSYLPEGVSLRAFTLSLSIRESSERIRFFTVLSKTGVAISTRFSRFLVIRSAEAMYTLSSPSLPKEYILECSRKRPTILMTEMFSLSFSTPGRRQQMPLTIKDTFTPALLASTSFSMHSRSVREFTFALMTPSLPLLISLSISAKSPFLRL